MPKIISFDLGLACTGYCVGMAGETPSRTGFMIPRPNNKDYTRYQALGRLGTFIQRLLEQEHPVDLIVRESELDPLLGGVEDAEGNTIITKKKKNTNKYVTTARYQMDGGCSMLCSMWRIKTVYYPRTTVLRLFTRCGKYPAIKVGKRLIMTGSEHGKRAVIQQCIRLGYVKPDETNDDKCDAIAVWYVASAEYFKLVPQEFALSDPPSLAHPTQR